LWRESVGENEERGAKGGSANRLPKTFRTTLSGFHDLVLFQEFKEMASSDPHVPRRIRKVES
jgi:hypothetical protein